MANNCLLYYITDRTAFAGDEAERRRKLLEKITEAATAGVDYIQLREKDLGSRDLERLARDAVRAIKATGSRTLLLINSRADIALATGADGVHLRSEDVTPDDVRKMFELAGMGERAPIIGVSCHTKEQVEQAAVQHASFVVFGPVFSKGDAVPVGLSALSDVGRAKIPVLALGGVTVENAKLCLRAGAAGIAGVRLFQENDGAKVVAELRGGDSATQAKMSDPK